MLIYVQYHYITYGKFQSFLLTIYVTLEAILKQRSTINYHHLRSPIIAELTD